MMCGHTDGADQWSKGHSSFRQDEHKPGLAEFRRLGVGESTDQILDDKQRLSKLHFKV